MLCLGAIYILIQLRPPLQPSSPISLHHIIQTLEGGGLDNSVDEEESNRQSAPWEYLLSLIAGVASLDPEHPVNGSCFPPALNNRSYAAGADAETRPSLCSSGPASTGRVRQKSRKIFTMWLFRYLKCPIFERSLCHSFEVDLLEIHLR